MSRERIKVLLAKPTQDCHDRGVRYTMTKLREAGMEVVFVNFLLPSEIVETAIQEGTDVIGVSSSSGGHIPVLEELRALLRVQGLEHVLVIAGGVIPDEDVPRLRALGVTGVFGPGASADEVIAFIKAHVARDRAPGEEVRDAASG